MIFIIIRVKIIKDISRKCWIGICQMRVSLHLLTMKTHNFRHFWYIFARLLHFYYSPLYTPCVPTHMFPLSKKINQDPIFKWTVPSCLLNYPQPLTWNSKFLLQDASFLKVSLVHHLQCCELTDLYNTSSLFSERFLKSPLFVGILPVSYHLCFLINEMNILKTMELWEKYSESICHYASDINFS